MNESVPPSVREPRKDSCSENRGMIEAKAAERLLPLRFFLPLPLERDPHESSIQPARGNNESMFDRGLSCRKKARVSLLRS